MSVRNLALLLTVFSLVLIPTANAEPYNITTDATKIYGKQWCVIPPFLTTPLDPKISCDTEGNNCIALVYDTCTTSSARVLWSVDKFDTHVQSLTPIGSSIDQTAWLDLYSADGSELYYDVAYFDDQKAFYMVFGNSVYVAFSEDIDGSGPASPLPTIYSPSSPLVTPTQTYGDTIPIDCATILTTPKDWAGLGYYCVLDNTYGFKFEDGDATNLWGMQLCQAYDTSPSTDWDGILCEWNYDVTNTTANRITNVVALDNTVSCSAGGNFGIDYLSVNNFWTGSDWKYNIEGQVDYCTGSTNVAIAEDTLGTPQDDWNQHYFGGNLYYRNFSLPNVSGSILSSETSDFTSFGTAETVYTEDSSINETINQSDSVTGGNNNLYIWERNSATDQGNDGIWVYRQTNIPITIETDEDTPVNVVLDCTTDSGTTYTDTGSGDYFTLNTLCQTGNRIIFTNSKRPNTHIEYFDIDTSCTDGLDIKLKYALTPYNHTVNVKTEDNIAIPNANVTIDSTTESTDVSGQAIIEIQSITGSTLKRINFSTCEVRMSTDGTGIEKDVLAEKLGYLDEEDTIPAPSKTYEGGTGYNFWTFTTTNTMTMKQTGMFLDIKVRAGSGVFVEPCNYNVTVSGPDIIQLLQGGVPILRDWADEFPAEFKFNHSSSPVTVDMTLYLPDGSTETGNISITYDSTNEFVFDIPYAIYNLPCDAQCDCPSSLCIDEYHYDLNGCINGTCEYTFSNCLFEEFCDDLVGCFDTGTTTGCTSDDDCANSCLDSDTMTLGLCGSDSLCKNVTVECAEECNTTLGLCEEKVNCFLGVDQKFKVGSNEYTVTCDVNTAGTSFCGDEIQLLKTQVTATYGSIENVPVTPDGWNYLDTENALGDEIYLFLAPKITCSDSCEMSIQYCGASGCDSETGECVGVGAGVDPIANMFAGWAAAITVGINTIFPSIYEKSIFTLLFIFGVSIVLLLLGRDQKDIALYILGIDIMIAMVMTFVGFLPNFVMIVAVILAGFLVFQGLFRR